MKNIKTPGVPDPIVAGRSSTYAGHPRETVLLTSGYISGLAIRRDGDLLSEDDKRLLKIAGEILLELCWQLYQRPADENP